MLTRRSLLGHGAAVAGATLLAQRSEAMIALPASPADVPPPHEPDTEGVRRLSSHGLHIPNGRLLPWRMVDGVKVFHLIAEPVEHEFAPGLQAHCWGYNGSTPGPVIEAVEGERVRIYVTNKLPEPTSAHWHGIFVPNGMDGVAGLNQPAIQPGETFVYEFTLRQHGTFMYHPHFDEMTQMGMGLMGMFIVHPKSGPTVDRDFVIMLSEWAIRPGARRPDPTVMSDFNVLTMNSKVFPATEPLMVQRGERVRIRFGNLSALDHHPIHLHGYRFHVTATDGGPVPSSARWPETTVVVPTGSTRDIEFVADVPGDWALHCHMTHHVMTQMGHGVPNMIGVETKDVDPRMRQLLPSYMTMGQSGMGDMAEMHMDVPENSIPMRGAPGPFGTIDMSGMFTIVKVRERGQFGEEWHRHPANTAASRASDEQMRRDGFVDGVLDTETPPAPRQAKPKAKAPSAKPAPKPQTPPPAPPPTHEHHH